MMKPVQKEMRNAKLTSAFNNDPVVNLPEIFFVFVQQRSPREATRRPVAYIRPSVSRGREFRCIQGRH